MDKRLEYKRELFNAISIDSESNSVFPEESFFEYVSELLEDAGILDNVEYCPYRNSQKGIKIDGYSWNPLERTVSGLVVNFTNDPDVVDTLTNSEINEIGKRVTRYFESITKDRFIDSLEVVDPGRIAAGTLVPLLESTLKFRVLIITDQVISARVRKATIESILDKETSIEIWDLDRISALANSGSEYEEFTVNLAELGEPIRALPANTSGNSVSTYLGVMPGTLLSAIYEEFGQRLLESNVRTFLDFRSGPNSGMRRSLVTEPENFFAYNNGITVTATDLETEERDGHLLIKSLTNMQIVNGGQTTAAIYFSPKDKGGIKGIDRTFAYSDIDLSKVFVQMKLSVIDDKETSDEMKGKIATFANHQNAIQKSDLVSNHPFHLNVETRSRKQLMPAGPDGFSTKWFYERTRGQYSTQLRALTATQKTRFQTEYPKKQVFSKTDFAKYENTWRMNPHIVKKGAQANLKDLGKDIVREFERDENQFGPAFFNDFVSKMILFREVDKAVLKADWYQQERGFKAEIVTYSIALIRHKLLRKNCDIDLESIFKAQAVPGKLLAIIVDAARVIRESITDYEFTGGVANPSEFCKSERGWKLIQNIEIDLSALGNGEILSAKQVTESKVEKKEVNKVGKTIGILEQVMQVPAEEWELLSRFYSDSFPSTHMNVGIPTKCVELIRFGRMPSDKQLKLAIKIRESAYKEGFDFVA